MGVYREMEINNIARAGALPIIAALIVAVAATLLCGAAIFLFFQSYPHSSFRFVVLFISLILLSHFFVRILKTLANA